SVQYQLFLADPGDLTSPPIFRRLSDGFRVRLLALGNSGGTSSSDQNVCMECEVMALERDRQEG
ncbi:MAG TPA: hypothetical protein VJ044_17225, partial [Candidatus Hodarchaeales archaeon]|nr:hypothetical protein [Candidatus Hodarchaeales archaeon]